MSDTKIRWTEAVWNPVTGCTKVSPGCKHCYAERMAKRLAGRNGYPAAPHQFDVTLHPDKLTEPLHWKKPRRVFVNSMSDLFHAQVPDEFIENVFGTMFISPFHTFQILTKRPQRMFEFVIAHYERHAMTGVYPNIWLGVSCEDQKTADERIPLLLQTPAAVRFVSAEPLLGPIDLEAYLMKRYVSGRATYESVGNPWLDWLIVGGESGPHARPMDLEWARSLRGQCHATQTPFFFKQTGGARSETGQLLDGQRYEQFPRG